LEYSLSRLDPGKLHVTIDKNLRESAPLLPRKYTLTHSDVTGDLFLTIGREFDYDALSDWYTRLMRDEVLAEWLNVKAGLALHIHLHVSGGLALGPAKWRESMFKKHLPLVLETICYGDRQFILTHPTFQYALIKVHFHAKQTKLNMVEIWKNVNQYLISIQ
jgi:magnesium dechelatase